MLAFLCLLLLNAGAAAQQPTIEDVAGVARSVLADYHAADRETYLDNLFRLQVGASQFEDAQKTLGELRDLRSRARGLSPLSTLPYEVYVEAKLREKRDHSKFDDAFRGAFRDIVGALDDRDAATRAPWVFGTSPVRLEQEARSAFEKFPDRSSPAQSDAIDLVRKVVAANVYRSFQPMLQPLFGEDDQRRYIIEKNHLVTTPDGAQICTFIVRPRNAAKPLPALLNFTIYSGPVQPMFEARRSASNGYIGVEGFTRGKMCGPEKPVPVEHDGADADAVIEWIARQPWCDGRVGMYGGSYEGFTQWAAAKHRPKALKAMMPSVTFAPGIDFPMDGNVFTTYAYPWPFYTTNHQGLDDDTYNDDARWEGLYRKWYVSGRRYRDLDAIDGTPNPFFDRWLDHPDYDAYWQRSIPYQKEFARIDIPILTTTGYYDGGQLGALWYFTQHNKYRPGAEHYLVVGPYDHISGQRGTLTPLGRALETLRGYKLDPSAQIDVGELRYQWFNYIFKNAPKPAVLKDKVNYQVMGADLWKHAPSLAAMADHKLRLHLATSRDVHGYHLASAAPKRPRFISQIVDLADRSDVDKFFRGDFVDQSQDDWNVIESAPKLANGIEFVSDPIAESIEVSGLFSGRLDFSTNKKDFDLSVSLFELKTSGEYFRLSHFWCRASYLRDRSHRQLLTPGRGARFAFEAARLTSRKLDAGSRLAVVIAVIKQPREEINYGTGKVVSEETVADAGIPLRIQWSTDTYIDIPVGK